MSQTLHGSTGLVYLPERTLSRLENGVVQITRSYACRNTSASQFRSLFDVGRTMPGESGITILYQFTEIQRADGFIEFRVTGSGPDPSQPSTGQSALKVQDGRTVQNFPSGLVRVERIYVCPTADLARFRPLLAEGNVLPYDDGTPAIDGLYIFPTPNEVQRPDGYTEFRVSAYGRTRVFNGDLYEKQSVKDTYRYVINRPDTFNVEPPVPAIKEVIIFRFVIPTSEFTKEILQYPKINPVVIPIGGINPLVAGTVYEGQYQTTEGRFYQYRQTVLYLEMDSFNSINFGRWSEYIITWKPMAEVTSITSDRER